MPIIRAKASSPPDMAACGRVGKMGPAPSSGTRKAEATMAERATGMKLRGRHSNSNNSTASNIAAPRRAG